MQMKKAVKLSANSFRSWSSLRASDIASGVGGLIMRRIG